MNDGMLVWLANPILVRLAAILVVVSLFGLLINRRVGAIGIVLGLSIVVSGIVAYLTLPST